MQTAQLWLSGVMQDAWWRVWADAALKATVLLILAWLLTLAVRRSSAALRHRIWCLAFSGLIVLPLLSHALPQWRIPILPAPSVDFDEPPDAVIAETETENPADNVTASPADVSPETREFDLQSQMELEASLLRPPGPADLDANQPLNLAEDNESPDANLLDDAAEVAAVPVAEPDAPAMPPALLPAVWIGGIVFVLIPMALGLLRLLLLRAGSGRVTDACWVALLSDLCGQLRIARKVRLLETRHALIPMTWGVLSPVVLLPEQARQWTDRLRRFVLLHELAHVKRFDVAFQILARVACAVYWFHPLAWYALRRLRIEREMACDDCVVTAGERPADYAEELLEIARSHQHAGLTPAVAMAVNNSLERRVRALFDRTCSHLPLSSSTARRLLVCTLLIVPLLAVVHPGTRAASEESEAAAAVTDDAESETSDENVVSAATVAVEPEVPAGHGRLKGRVVDTNERPVPNGRVVVVRSFTEDHSWNVDAEVLAETRSDADGRFAVDYPAEVDRFGTPEAFAQHNTFLVVKAEGYAFGWSNHPLDSPEEQIVTLEPGEGSIEGRVLDLEGRPIPGIQVTLNSITTASGSVAEWAREAKNNPVSLDERYYYYYSEDAERPKIARFPTGTQLNLQGADLLPSVVTDDEGRFRVTGLGADRLCDFTLEGGGIAKMQVKAVTHDMQPVSLPDPQPQYRLKKCFGAKFDLTAEPMQLITGTVTDSETGEPLPGVEVRLSQYAESRFNVNGFLSTTTDGDGRYELRGVPKPNHEERKTELRLMPSAGQPFFRTRVEVPKRDGFEPVTCDVGLKRAITVRGRLLDGKTNEPIWGFVSYYPFRSNELAEDYSNFEAGVRSMGYDDWYATNEDGTFQVPAIAGRGILTAIAEHPEWYPLGEGAEEIAELRETQPNPFNLHKLVYHLHEVYLCNALREIAPPDGAEKYVADITLTRFDVKRIRFVDTNGQPVEGVRTRGLWPRRPFTAMTNNWNRDAGRGPIAEIAGFEEFQPRPVLFHQQERQLGAALRLSLEDFANNEALDVTLPPCGSVTGRIVDEHGEPVAGAKLIALFEEKPQVRSDDIMRVRMSLNRWSQSLGGETRTDSAGRFHITDLPSGERCTIRWDKSPQVPRYYYYAPPPIEWPVTPPVEPGATVDLGDLRVPPEKSKTILGKQSAETDESTSDEDTTENAATKGGSGAPAEVDTGDSAGDNSRSDVRNPESSQQPSADASSKETVTISGRIVGSDGKAVAGAHVAAIGMRLRAGRGGDLKPRDEVFAETRTDENGDYRLTLRGVSSNTHRYTKVIARSDGTGLAWKPFDPDADTIDASFGLREEKPIRGRLVDVEGQPATGVRLVIQGVMETARNGERPQGVGFRDIENLPAAWPQPVTTDDEGRFSLQSIAAGHGVLVNVEGNDRFAPQSLAINTGRPEQRAKSDATYRSQVKNVEPGEEVLLALAPAQVFEGVVRYEDSGEPAPHARLTVWASQQKEFGSMVSVAGKADAKGRYRINPKPGIRFGVTAYPPDGVPYLTRKIEPINWQGSERVKQVDVALPRGVLVQGRILESGTNTPVSEATIQYMPETSNNSNTSDDILTGWQGIQTTGEDGRFKIVVLPGLGRLLVHGPDGEYVLQQISSRQLNRGLPGGKRYYAHAIHWLNPAPNAEPVEVALSIERGQQVTGRLVDQDGQPIDEALVITRLNIHATSAYWRGFPRQALGGRFELSGLAEEEEYPVYFLEPNRRLGATAMIRAGMESPTVVLKPCGQASAKFTDRQGKPLVALHPALEMVVTPGVHEFSSMALKNGRLAADADYVGNIDRTNHRPGPKTDEQGRITFPALIPGGVYRIVSFEKGTAFVATEFTAESQQTLDLGEWTQEDGNRFRRVRETSGDSRAPVKDKSSTVSAAEPGSLVNDEGASKPSPADDSRNEAVTVRGRVLDPAGRSAVGARVFTSLSTAVGRRFIQRGMTDENGSFEFELPSAEPTTDGGRTQLVAAGDGYGLNWVDLDGDAGSREWIVKLVNDQPVRGRVLDTEGRPVHQPRIWIQFLMDSSTGRLDDFLAAWRKVADMSVDAGALDRRLYGDLSDLVTVDAVDDNGRFEIHGLGTERLAGVVIAAANITRTRLSVVLREPFDAREINNEVARRWESLLRPGPPKVLYGPSFDFVGAPGRMVEGFVRDAASREPVADAVVRGDGGYGGLVVSRTDASGHYQLVGMGRHREQFRIEAFLPENTGPLMSQTVRIDNDRGSGPLTYDIDLPRGAVIQGRVIDKATGEGVAASLQFVPLPENKHPGKDKYESPFIPTKDDGRFRMVTIPGPGLLLAVASARESSGQSVVPYTTARLSASDREHVTFAADGRHIALGTNRLLGLYVFHAARFLNAAKSAEPANVDLYVNPGQTQDVRLEDTDGRPISGVYAGGIAATSRGATRVDGPQCTVYALESDRPRTVVFYHPERQLAATLNLTAGGSKPLKVRLKPTGTLVGRALDRGGAPLKSAEVMLRYRDSAAFDLYNTLDIRRQRTRTDDQGSFQHEGILPSVSFSLRFQDGSDRFVPEQDGSLNVESGKTSDLGEFRTR